MRHFPLFVTYILLSFIPSAVSAQTLKLNDRGFFESRGIEVRVYDNADGLRIFEKERLIVSSGGVSFGARRLSQADRNPDIAGDRLEIKLSVDSPSVYLKARPSELGISYTVFLSEPLPLKMKDSVRFDMHFVPSEYMGKTCIVDGRPYMISGGVQSGRSIVLAPEDDSSRISFRSEEEMTLSFDGNDLVLASAIPVGRNGNVLQWYVEPSYDSRWARRSEIGWSRIGYVNGQRKTAVITADSKDTPESNLRISKISEDGYRQQILQTSVRTWGQKDQKNDYLVSDFSMLRESGIYCLEYGDLSSGVFIVSEDVFAGKWKKALERMSAVLESSECDHLNIVIRLSRLWELFRPEGDFSGNGVPDVIDLVKHFAMDIAGVDASSDASDADGKFRRIAALAASSRVLRGFDDEMSSLLENLAVQMWNLNGKTQSDCRFEAAVQMWLSTGNPQFKNIVFQSLTRNSTGNDSFARILPVYQVLDTRTRNRIDDIRRSYSTQMRIQASSSPYGIPDMETAELLEWAMDYYLLWLNFPETTDSSAIFSSLSAIYGRHTFLDESLLDSISPACMPDFIALSMAVEKIAALPLN